MDSVECWDLRARFQTMHNCRENLNFHDLARNEEADDGALRRTLKLPSIRSGHPRNSDKICARVCWKNETQSGPIP